MTFPALRFLDRENALALLPIPSECLAEVDDALAELNAGERGGTVGSIDKLIQINKRSRFNTRPWGRLQQGAVLNFAVSYRFISFEMEDAGEYVFSFPDGHRKLLHLWPVKLLQAGRLHYDDSGVMAMRAAASFRR